MTKYTLTLNEDELNILQSAVDIHYVMYDDNLTDEILSEVQSMYKDDRKEPSQVRENINKLLDNFKASITIVEKINNLK